MQKYSAELRGTTKLSDIPLWVCHYDFHFTIIIKSAGEVEDLSVVGN